MRLIAGQGGRSRRRILRGSSASKWSQVRGRPVSSWDGMDLFKRERQVLENCGEMLEQLDFHSEIELT